MLDKMLNSLNLGLKTEYKISYINFSNNNLKISIWYVYEVQMLDDIFVKHEK